jgi:VWFA-related protein
MSMSIAVCCRKHGAFRLLSGLLTLAAALLAQSAAAQTPMKEPIDVRVTNVEIIATDAKGQHVSGLTRDDFELYENGKLQPITNLFEANAGTQGDSRKAALPRRLVIYLDDSTLLPNNRRPIVPALKKLIADTMAADDQVMIATFSQSMKIRLPWTSDMAAVQSTLDSVGSETGNGRIRQAARKRIEDDIRSAVSAASIGKTSASDFRDILSGARNYASSVTHDLALSAGALQNLFESLAAVDGRKIVFIASESFSTRPGEEVFTYLENVRQQVLSGDASEGLKASARTASVTSAASEFNTNDAILALGRVANAAGVTVYALDPDTSGGGLAESGNLEQLVPGQLQSSTSARTPQVDGLQILAHATGGLAWIGMRPALAVEKLRADLENYYSLGYQAKTGGGAERSIEVKPKRADVRVRAKNSIRFRSAEAEMTDRVVANLRSAQLNDLGISLQVVGDVRTEGEKRHVPVHVMIPARNLTVVPEGNVLTGGFSVYVCTAGGKAEPSGVNEQSHEIKWPLSTTVEQLKDRPMVFAMEVVLEKGRDQISVGVLDHRSQATGFSKIAM